MAKLTIDDKEYQVTDGNNLLHACLSLGLNLPYFCWHPCMGSVGACRQCAVKHYQDENDERGRIVMACMTPASDGARLSIQDPDAKDFRAGIIELLMTNHPHDCPVCEEGGECHLQDMTEMSGHNVREYRNTKRTHRNQYLGPLINHEMNRCIACYRCVRYYQDYAGGDDLQAMGSRENVYFGRHADGVLKSPFSGNLVEVCPTGVFTDRTFSQHFTRKWDLQTAPSVCQHCAIGCNTSPGERYGELKRISNRYHDDINGYFLCDRGRFGYGHVNSEQRLHQPLIRQQASDSSEGAIATSLSSEAAQQQLQALFRTSGTIAIGSPRASLESNYALQQAVGAANFYRGFAAPEDPVITRIAQLSRHPAIHLASLKDVKDCDAVIVLGEDLTQTAPLLALSLRQTVKQKANQLADQAGIPRWQNAAVRELAQEDKSPLFILHPTDTALDDIAESSERLAPEKIAEFGFTLASQLADTAPRDNHLAGRMAQALIAAKRPLIITGSSLFNKNLINAAAAIASALESRRQAPIDAHFTLPECNSLGLAVLTEQQPDNTLEAAITRIQQGKATQLVILENDLYRRHSPVELDAAFEPLDSLVVIDQRWHNTCAKADLIIPAASFAEADGTLVSSEGRAQRYFAVYPTNTSRSDARPSWQWLNLALDQRWDNFDALNQACADSSELLTPIAEIAPAAEYRQHGLKVPRMSHRYSGRTAINAGIHVSEPKQPEDNQSALGFTMEGTATDLPPSLRPATWSPGWNSNQSIHKFQQEVAGPLRGGSSGARLFDRTALKIQSIDINKLPPKDAKLEETDKQLLPIPLYHIFGSDEMSADSAAIAELSPSAYIALSAVDADALALEPGNGVEFTLQGSQMRLAVAVYPELPQGLVGLPMGLATDHCILNPSHLTNALALRKADHWPPKATANDAQVIATDSGYDHE